MAASWLVWSFAESVAVTAGEEAVRRVWQRQVAVRKN
jgi:hypothetical protein